MATQHKLYFDFLSLYPQFTFKYTILKISPIKWKIYPKIETLKNPLNLSRLATGDALSVTNGAAKIDPKAYQGPQQGGATSAPGDGGAAVWQKSLIPAERETLKRFFK